MPRQFRTKLLSIRKGSPCLKTSLPEGIRKILGAEAGDELEWKKLSSHVVVRLVKREKADDK
jgi:hypothetical protein